MEKKKALLLNVAYYGFFAVVIYLAWELCGSCSAAVYFCILYYSFSSEPCGLAVGKAALQE